VQNSKANLTKTRQIGLLFAHHMVSSKFLDSVRARTVIVFSASIEGRSGEKSDYDEKLRAHERRHRAEEANRCICTPSIQNGPTTICILDLCTPVSVAQINSTGERIRRSCTWGDTVFPCLEGRAPRGKKDWVNLQQNEHAEGRGRGIMDNSDRSQPLYPTEGLCGRNPINVLYLRRSKKFASVLEFRPTGHACPPLQSQFGQTSQFTAVDNGRKSWAQRECCPVHVVSGLGT
jgi:hypothetical protein